MGADDNDGPALGHKKNRGWWHKIEELRFQIISYCAAAVLIFFVWHFLSDSDFSFLMTLGSLLTLFSFALLVAKVVQHKAFNSVSIKSLHIYALLYACRLCSILVYEGYLPFDKSGDWFYQTCEVIALVMVAGLIFVFHGPFSSQQKSSNAKNDAFFEFKLPASVSHAWIVAPCLVLAVILHPNLNGNWFTDTAWTFALYLEALAMLPQMALFQNQRKNSELTVDGYTQNFVFGMAIARVLNFLFWVSSYHELNDKYAETFHRKYPGVMVVLSQVVSLLVMCEYIYMYLAAARDKNKRPLLGHIATQSL